MWLLLEIAAPVVAAFAGFVLAAALAAGAAEDAYRAGYLAGIRAVAQMGRFWQALAPVGLRRNRASEGHQP